MSYVDSILQQGEHVLRVGRVHWIVYWRALVLVAICGLFLHLALHQANSLQTAFSVVASVLGLLAVLEFARTWLWIWTTELAITNRRVIYKRGLIWRRTVEMNMDKVETVAVEQSILGRVLNYGTLHVRGTGQSIEHLGTIAAPVALRNAILAR